MYWPSKQLTTGKCTPTSEEIVVRNDEIIGIKVTHVSDNACKIADSVLPVMKDGEVVTYSFTYTVLCDESNTEDGGAVEESTNANDPCAPEVIFSHAAGCH